MTIREFKIQDINEIVEILKLNNQYDFPDVDGPEAMKRLNKCDATLFLTYEIEEKVVGFIRGTFDGSRAMIHLLSIHPNYQKRNIGKELVAEIIKKFNNKGSNTVSATVTDKSYGFWEKIGFKKVDVIWKCYYFAVYGGIK